MCENPLFSVVIPVYNTADYLERCVNSVLAQTYADFEVILVDDGSEDGSSRICDTFSEMDPRIITIHQNNMGSVKARKVGGENSRGSYVTFMDSDDWIESNAFEEYARVLKKYHPDVMEFTFVKEYSGITTKRGVQLEPGYYSKQEFEEAYNELLFSSWPFVYVVHDGLCTKVIKNDLLKLCQNNVNDNITMGDDTAVSVQVQVYLESIYISDIAFYHYCVREGSISYADKSEKYDSFTDINKHFANVMRIPECKPIFKKNMLIRSFELMLDYFNILPEEYFLRFEKIPFFNDVCKEDRVIVYGKGKYAQNFIKIINRFSYAKIIDNVDSADCESKLRSLKETDYDSILIAIADYNTTRKIVDCLIEMGVRKIKCLDYEFMKLENLPDDIIDLYRDVL